jgi:hypothetical protein
MIAPPLAGEQRGELHEARARAWIAVFAGRQNREQRWRLSVVASHETPLEFDPYLSIDCAVGRGSSSIWLPPTVHSDVFPACSVTNPRDQTGNQEAAAG